MLPIHVLNKLLHTTIFTLWAMNQFLRLTPFIRFRSFLAYSTERVFIWSDLIIKNNSLLLSDKYAAQGLFLKMLALTLSWRRPLSYRNQSTDLPPKSMDWFLYDNGLHHEIGNESGCFSAKNILSNKNWAARNCKSLLFLLPFLINFFKYSNILSSSASANFAACPILGYLCPPNKESHFRRNKMFRLKRYSFSVSNCRSIE